MKQGGGTGISGLLLVGFILLKVAGVIDWSWVWVLAPLWASLIVELLTNNKEYED